MACFTKIGAQSLYLGNFSKQLAALRRRKYEVWLLDEFRTSKSCSRCHCAGSDCAPHVPKVGGKARHGLLRCKNVECKQFHNRNANATRNMIRVVRAVLDGADRPQDLKRRSGSVVPCVLSGCGDQASVAN